MLFSVLACFLSICISANASSADTDIINSEDQNFSWSGAIAEGFEAGCGTKLDPYIISSPEQLAYLAMSVNAGNTYMNQYIRLETDIILNAEGDISALIATGETGTLRVWTPIGNSEKCFFRGNFDGNFHTISGVYIFSNEDHQGLFGYVYGSSIINLEVKNSYISGKDHVGGIAGYNGGVLSCVSFGGTVMGNAKVGGLVGTSAGGIYNCFSSAAIEGEKEIGGLIGCANQYSSTIHCYSTGLVKGASLTGSAIGNLTSKTAPVANCYVLKEENSNTQISIGNYPAHKHVHIRTAEDMHSFDTYSGWNFNEIWTINPSNPKGFPTHIKGGSKESVTTGETWDGTIASTFESGSGTIDDPYMIASAEQLARVSYIVNNGNSCAGLFFCLQNDIILNDTSIDCWVASAKEWVPIGINNVDFKGHLNGNGFAIKGIYINSNFSAGLFDTIYGTVANLKIDEGFICSFADGAESAAIAATNHGIISNCVTNVKVVSQSAGGIAGTNKKEIYNCDNYGILTAYRYCCGGICAVNQKLYSSANGTVNNCSNYGNVTTYDTCVGGIAGWNYSAQIMNCKNFGSICGGDSSGGIVGSNDSVDHNVQLFNCSNHGDVSGEKNVGGIAGFFYGDLSTDDTENNATIQNCYNDAPVTGEKNVGGIVGWSRFEGDIRNCCNAGNVLGGTDTGGIVGYLDSYASMNIINCFYLKIDTVNSNLGGIHGADIIGSAQGCSKKEFSSPETFSGFDLFVSASDLTSNPSNVWILEDNSYPKLFLDLPVFSIISDLIIVSDQIEIVFRLGLQDSASHIFLATYTDEYRMFNCSAISQDFFATSTNCDSSAVYAKMFFLDENFGPFTVCLPIK